MPTPLPITIRSSPLPSDWRGTPEAFKNALVARLTLETQEQLALIAAGSVAPTSDVGPWAKNNNTWYYWDSVSGSYVPFIIEFKPQLNSKPWRANSAAAQDIVFAAPSTDSVDLVLSQVFDPDGVYDANLFTAPDDGFYHIDCKIGIAGTAGTPTDNLITFYLKKNGFQIPTETVFEPVGNVLDGRTLSISTNIQLAAGDTIGGTVSISVGGGSGTWTITQNDTFMSGYKIRNLTF